MPIDAALFRQAMAELVTGVAVVCARESGGRVVGMTASSVASLSLVPPMLLVCVDHEADLHPVIVSAPEFAVSVLAVGQEDAAVRFATRGQQILDAAGLPAAPGGLPLIQGAVAHILCRRAAVYEGGDHSIVTGTVEWAETSPGLPLCYHRSSYSRLSQ